MNGMTIKTATVGVSDHAGWAVLVTVGGTGAVLDSRRIQLVDDDLPSLPHHHQGQRLPLEEALVLIERVRCSAGQHARRSLEAVESVHSKVSGIVLRQCPTLPATVAGRIQSYWAQTRADTVMYRQALAEAAEARGWIVHWYDATKVLNEACQVLGVADLESEFAEARKLFGPPWNKDHRLAMAAAIASSPTG